MYFWLPLRKMRGRPEHYLTLSFALGYELDSPRVVSKAQPRPGLYMHHILLVSPGDLDGELLGWLRDAYDFSLR